jgi:hypothetical protein
MPVIECSCGMVMSVSAAEPRNSCIRCGGAEFHELGHRKPIANMAGRLPARTVTGSGSPLAAIVMSENVTEPVAVVCVV